MGAKVKVEKWQPETDGALSVETMKKKLTAQGYHFTVYDFPPGTNFPDHTHGFTKKDSIVTGQFQFTMYGETVILEPGDMVEVPKDTVHNAKVVGNKTVTFFDASR